MIPRLLVPADLTATTLSGWLEAIVRADAAGWPAVLLRAASQAEPFDGLALAAHCATRTHAITVCAAIYPATVEPFTLARGLATLDHLSRGRAAWYLTPGSERERVAELAEVVTRLLLSWDEDALIADAPSGMLSRADAARPIAHDGAFFHVRGPLNVPRPPQGAVPRIVLPGDPPAAQAARFSEDDIATLTLDRVREALA